MERKFLVLGFCPPSIRAVWRGFNADWTGMALSLSLGASGASESIVEGSECAVFSEAGSVGSWGLAGVEFSSGVGFWLNFGRRAYQYIITEYDTIKLRLKKFKNQ